MQSVLRAFALSILTFVFTHNVAANTTEKEPANAAMVAEGKALSFDQSKGNCLACHVMADGESPGNIGPPLIAMQARYPDKAQLREQIFDARAKNPTTIMPPFGAHVILSDEELDKITEFVYSL